MKYSYIIILLLSFLISTVHSQHMSAGFQVGLAPPIGEFADQVTTGFGAQGNFNWIFNDHLNATASVGYYTWVGTAEVIEYFYDYKFYSIPLTLGLKYIIGNSEIKPFALAELGVHITNSSYLLPTEINNYYTVYSEKAEKNETCFGASIGGGILVPMGKRVSFDTQIKFTSIAAENITKHFFSIITGVTVLIKS